MRQCQPATTRRVKVKVTRPMAVTTLSSVTGRSSLAGLRSMAHQSHQHGNVRLASLIRHHTLVNNNGVNTVTNPHNNTSGHNTVITAEQSSTIINHQVGITGNWQVIGVGNGLGQCQQQYRSTSGIIVVNTRSIMGRRQAAVITGQGRRQRHHVA